MNEVQPQACSWQVNGLQLAGLSWGSPGGLPVLALHGWLDNAASYSMLAPLLENCHVVALDVTGHGHSDCRSADASYQIWDDLPEIQGVVDALGWERFCLMGHSRGAIISTLFASSLPERVERLVLLDAVLPHALDEAEFPGQMRKFLQQKSHWQNRDKRVFRSVDAAVATRDNGSLPTVAAQLLAERNLTPCEGGYTWSTDPRLRGASAVKLTAGHIQAVLQGLPMPTLVLLAEEGLGGEHPELAEQARKWVRELDLRIVPGGHHFHMEEGVDNVAQQISQFLHS